MNVENKKVIVYVDGTLENLPKAEQEVVDEARKLGAIIINKLEDLKGMI